MGPTLTFSAVFTSFIDFAYTTYILTQPGFVQCPKPLQQDGGIPEQAAAPGFEMYMDEMLALDVPCDGGSDGGRAMVVPEFSPHATA